MSYELVEPSFDITSSDNWVTLLKFWGVNILVSMVVALLVVVIFYTFIAGSTEVSDGSLKGAVGGAVNGGLMSIVPIVPVILMGQMYILGWFERMDGCYKKKV